MMARAMLGSASMRTLSARILLGFAVLTIAFGVITATVVVNMSLVENQLVLIGQGYWKLAIGSKNLALTQGDIGTELQQLKPDSPADLRRGRMRMLRNRRDNQVQQLRNVLNNVGQEVPV